MEGVNVCLVSFENIYVEFIHCLFSDSIFTKQKIQITLLNGWAFKEIEIVICVLT